LSCSRMRPPFSRRGRELPRVLLAMRLELFLDASGLLMEGAGTTAWGPFRCQA
jgi:hypothetical protein